jgi:hypothetical protein
MLLVGDFSGVVFGGLYSIDPVILVIVRLFNSENFLIRPNSFSMPIVSEPKNADTFVATKNLPRSECSTTLESFLDVLQPQQLTFLHFVWKQLEISPENSLNRSS